MWDFEGNRKRMREMIAKCDAEEERIIAEQYNGDREAYEDARSVKYEREDLQKTAEDIVNFNMMRASFDAAPYMTEELGSVEDCLRRNLPSDSSRITVLDKNRHCESRKDEEYPGGYEAFLQDIMNGYFGDAMRRQWKGVCDGWEDLKEKLKPYLD